MPTHSAIQYAVLFSDKIAGKRFAELTNTVDTIAEAISDARQSYADGYLLMGLYQIDYITRDQKQLHTGKQLEALFDAEETAEREAQIEDERYGSYADQMHGWRAAL